jgi:hypothetical protein
LKENHPPVWFRWFLYYLVVLSVPMFLGMIIYFHSRQIINRNSEEIYAASLEQARIESDGLIDTEASCQAGPGTSRNNSR